MTILNVLSITGLLVLIVAVVVIHRKIKRTVDDADGVGTINEYGSMGESREGDCLGEFGIKDTDLPATGDDENNTEHPR